MVLTDRDCEILVAVHKHRFLTRDHIASIFFPASPLARSETLLSSCNSRLQKLFHNGYLSRQVRGQTLASEMIYALDKRGVRVVSKLLGLDSSEVRWSPKRSMTELYFREHTLAINDLWVAFELAAREHSELSVRCFEMDGPLLWDWIDDRDAPRGYLPVRPDAFMQLAWGDKLASFFLEVDRATMTRKRFVQKIRAYRLYWRSGGFERAYEAASFRVLTSTPSERRRDSLRQAARAAGASRMFLFAVHDAVRSGQLFEPIWFGPSDEEPMPLVR
ncbi:MAG: replication-relaxation family protein [Gaiellaceae bacterium]